MGVKSPIAANPLRTKADLELAFSQLTKPLLPYYSAGGARLGLNGSGAGQSPDVAQMEGFSRIIWGLAPLAAGSGKVDEELLQLVLKGITNGTDPAHAEYWGKVADYDQRLVEMASLGLALAIAPQRLWEPLSDRAKQRFYDWLNQINSHKSHDCNWLFFHVLVNVGFHKLGLPYAKDQLDSNLNRLEDFYLEDGWFEDGVNGHSDYYVPLAFHYCGLIYAALMKEEDPERAARFEERGAVFARQFANWFSEDGRALPYGRSLTYRFAQGALWGAYAFAGVQPFEPGVIKGLYLRHLRWWLSQPIFSSDGVLTVGYSYPNLIMAENYNAPGSVYWAFKAFLPLALPDDHPLWQAEELPLPELPAISVQKAPHLVICRHGERDHIAAFNAGHRSTNEHTHTSAKYEKFVYSASFGFSVPRAEWGLSQGAYDSMLALSEGDNLYRVRRKNEETHIDGDVLTSVWKPWRDVTVKTYLLAGLPWHLRIHRIETARELDAAEGGFALPLDSLPQVSTQAGSVIGRTGFGSSGITGLQGFERAELVSVQSNTNLMHQRTSIPTLLTKLKPGKHVLVSAVYGEPGAEEEISPDQWRDRIGLSVEPDRIKAISPSGKEIIIDL
ncbi:DUF2264 domain-containing protein [Paenibacillus glycanilyticus]|uniref:DUF2264 domain-containing protein n=1 Tax=Paenibacillus glycanilyticus TaxID=126569 RepID=UPI00203C05AF|nr:DUF2264 domain-containing protein [Paenibacillus glycanilyticus]MCM3626586.1 DUF2264 domain-containing protein [Paenibacillus glycanilyticus]